MRGVWLASLAICSGRASLSSEANGCPAPCPWNTPHDSLHNATGVRAFSAHEWVWEECSEGRTLAKGRFNQLCELALKDSSFKQTWGLGQDVHRRQPLLAATIELPICCSRRPSHVGEFARGWVNGGVAKELQALQGTVGVALPTRRWSHCKQQDGKAQELEPLHTAVAAWNGSNREQKGLLPQCTAAPAAFPVLPLHLDHCGRVDGQL